MRTGPKEWSPRNPEPAEKIVRTLRQLAPSVGYDVSWEEDESFVWDGEGPNPMTEGYVAHNVYVIIQVIMEGHLYRLTETLGGVYDKPGEEDPEIHGYLPQMLEEVTARMMKREMPSPLLAQLRAAHQYLKEVLKIRHKRQR